MEDFLDSLPGKIAQKIAWVLQLVEERDVLPVSYFKKLVNTDIWECRTQFGSNSYRILCFYDNENVVILTHGFMKKTQKTPPAEIERAVQYMNDYLQRSRP